MASVRLDGMLRTFTPRLKLASDAPSVGRLLDELEERYPGLRGRLRDELGRLRPFVRVFVNGTLVSPDRLGTARLGAEDSVDILHSIQGG